MLLLLSLCTGSLWHSNKFLVCANILGNKALSDFWLLLTFDVLNANIWMLNTQNLWCWYHWFEVLWFWPHWRWRCTHEGSAAQEGYRSHPEYSRWATRLWTSEGNRYPSPAPDPNTLTHTGIHVDISKPTAIYLRTNYAKRTIFNFTRKHVQSHAAHCDHSVWSG